MIDKSKKEPEVIKTAKELEIEKSMIREHPDWLRYISNPSQELCEIAISSMVEKHGEVGFKNVVVADFISEFRKNPGK